MRVQVDPDTKAYLSITLAWWAMFFTISSAPWPSFMLEQCAYGGLIIFGFLRWSMSLSGRWTTIVKRGYK